MKQLVEIFRSPREEGLYLYVDRKEGLSRVPEVLLARFGKPESSMVLMLEPTRPLARANANTVLDTIREQGFYLQMPHLTVKCLPCASTTKSWRNKAMNIADIELAKMVYLAGQQLGPGARDHPSPAWRTAMMSTGTMSVPWWSSWKRRAGRWFPRRQRRWPPGPGEGRPCASTRFPLDSISSC